MEMNERVDAVVDLLCKASKRRRKVIPKALVQHTKHCLTTVGQKQASFQTALQVLARQVWPSIVQGIRQGGYPNSSQQGGTTAKTRNTSNTTSASLQASTTAIDKEHVPKVLEHIFSQILRLHDALVLLVSGECRHHGDIQATKPFPTRLTQNATRADGYTQLYKATSVYSGASMDEWNDERNGLRVAWQDWLQGGPEFWERLLEKHTILEAFLNDLDTQMQQLQQEFSTVTSRIVDDIQGMFPEKRVKISLSDQMEVLSVDPWSWERRGKNFQWKDPLGILPAGWTASQWYKSLAWQPPPTSTVMKGPSKKRRRVIQDDDEDEDEDKDTIKLKVVSEHRPAAKENQTQPLAEGLRVKTKTTKDRSESIDSLNRIKTQLGVNVEALQEAREGLEAEEAIARDEAIAFDEMSVDFGIDDRQRREECIRRASRLSRQLQKIEERRPLDMYDLWDARECLREALMEAGNVHLWSDSKSEEKHEFLRRADNFFTQSLTMVKAQQELHGRMVSETIDSDELKMCWRNLLLLQAQALVNRGIALVEMGQRKISDAIRHFDESVRVCRTLHKVAAKDRENGASVLETTLDSLRAHETQSLALRWKGEALWKLGRQAEAIAIFHNSGNIYKQVTNQFASLQREQEIIRVFLSVRTESYYAWARLIDLQSQDTQRSPHVLKSDERWRSIQNILNEAFVGAVSCSRAFEDDVQKYGNTVRLFLKDHDVVSVQALLDAEKNLMNDLRSRREILTKRLSVDTGDQRLVQRSDVADTAAEVSNNSSRWLLSGNKIFKKRGHRKRYGAGYSNIRVSGLSDEMPAQDQPKRRFRKWGDDFFPKKRNEKEELVPDLPYPYRAPEMPAHIQAVLERKLVLER